MANAKALGFKVGDYFLVTKPGSFSLAAIVQLNYDDGTKCPRFQLVQDYRGAPVLTDGAICYEEFSFVQHMPDYDPFAKPDTPLEKFNVLEEAQRIIYGDREETYGDPGKNLRHIAEQWTLYLAQKYGIPVSISAEDVCYMMADLKKCRQLHKPKHGNVVDGIGYLALTERL